MRIHYLKGQKKASLVFTERIAVALASVKFGQIRPEIWPKPNLAEFGKNGRISDLPKPKPKFGATLINITVMKGR